TRKFRQQPVAGCLYDAAVMLGDLRVDQLSAMRLEAFEGAFLVGAPSGANSLPHRRRGSRQDGGLWSLFRHSGLAQPGDISRVEQGADLRHPKILDTPQVGNAQIRPFAPLPPAFPPGFPEFCCGACGLAFEGISGAKPNAWYWISRKSAPRSFEPEDRL